MSAFIRNVSIVEEWERRNLVVCSTTLLCLVVRMLLRMVCVCVCTWRVGEGMCRFLVVDKDCKRGRRIGWAKLSIFFDCPCIDRIIV